MGYYTTVTGTIAIDPPLTWTEIKDSPFLATSPAWREVRLAVVEDTTETDQGMLTVRYANAIIPTEDSYKAYDIEKHLQELVSRFPDRSYSGYLEGEGEDNEDMWRLGVRDGRAVMVRPKIVWPEF